MQDNTNIEKKQAEALSAAIDALNRGGSPETGQETELDELVRTARLVKNTSQAPAEPPQAVLEHIVNQAANTIIREKRKKRLAWGLAGLSGAVAAALLVSLLNVMPPVGPEQELAKTQQLAPTLPAEVLPPATIAKPAPEVVPAPASPADQGTKATKPEEDKIKQAADAGPQPSVGLAPSASSVPADSDTMLALAERKADVVTIDAVSKVIRQVYHQGAPDEIIITQAPKRQSNLRIAPRQPSEARGKMAARVPNESVEIKPPHRNRVTITVDDSEVTLEGAATEQELLNLSKSLTKVSVAK